MKKPHIKTAIPQRRFEVGEFLMVILDDIESNDPIEYRYLLATVVEGEAEPGLYLTCELNTPELRGAGKYVMRAIMRDGSQVIGSSDRWENLEVFTADALDRVIKILKLEEEEIRRLM